MRKMCKDCLHFCHCKNIPSYPVTNNTIACDDWVSKDKYVPVVQGRWIDKPTGAYGRWQSWCSACGKRSGIGGTKQHKPYCPNCGAKMDGGMTTA